MRRQRRRSRRISSAEPLGLAGVVAVGDDHDSGARIDHAARVPAIEGGEALADPRAAADALRHQRQLVDGAGDVAVAQRARRHAQAGCGTRRPPPRGRRRPRRAGSARRRRCRGSSSRRRRAGRRAAAACSLRRRQARSSGVPPCEMLRWMVRRRSRRRPRRRTRWRRTRRARMTRAEALGQRMRLRHIGGIDDVAQVGAGERSRREAPASPRPPRGRVALLVSRRSTCVGARRAGCGAQADGLELRAACARCSTRRRAACAPGACRGSANRRRRSRRSAPSPSGWRRTARAAPASSRRRPRRRRATRGRASASPVSASPTVKPLSRSVRAKPASRAADRAVRRRVAALACRGIGHRGHSRHLAEQPVGHLARAGGSRSSRVLSRHSRVSWTQFRVLRADRGSPSPASVARPVERFGDARDLAQFLLAHAATMPAICSASAASMPGVRATMMRASRSTSGKST